MTTLYFGGAEWGHKSAEDVSYSGTVNVTSAIKRTGGYGWSEGGASSWMAFALAGSDGYNYAARAYFRFLTLPTGADILQFYRSGDSASLCSVRVDSANGRLQLYRGATLVGSSSASSITTGVWYCIELACQASVAGDDRVEARLDGTSFASLYTAEFGGSTGPTEARFGNISAGNWNDIYWDDVCVTYAESTTPDWPGEGEVRLALPIGDDSNSNWRNGNASGTTNLYQSVDNLPPAGVASASETATSNIECAVSSGTREYIGYCPTYSDLGVTGDVLDLQAVAFHGEDISTGTKTGQVWVATNPVGSRTAFSFGSDAGAHGTWPTGWAAVRSAIIEDPSVLMTANVKVGVSKTDASTRVGCVAALGVLVHSRPPSGPAATTFTPASIATVLAVPAPTLAAGAVAFAPASIAAVLAVPQPTLTNVPPATVFAPAPVPVLLAVPAASLTPGAVTFAPAAVAAVPAVPTPSHAPGALAFAPAAVPVGLAVPSPTLSSGGAPTTFAPAPVAVVLAAPAPALGLSLAFAPAPVAAAVAAPSPTLGKALAFAPAPVAVVLAAPAPTLGKTLAFAPAPVAALLAVPTPGLDLGGTPVTFAPAPVALVLAAPAPALGGSLTFAPAPVAAQLAAPAPTLGKVLAFAPAPVAAVLAAPAPTLGKILTFAPAAVRVPLTAPASLLNGSLNFAPETARVLLGVPEPLVYLDQTGLPFGWVLVAVIATPFATLEASAPFAMVTGDAPSALVDPVSVPYAEVF